MAHNLNSNQLRAIGRYLSRGFGSVRFRVVHGDDDFVVVEIVRGLCCGVRVGIPIKVISRASALLPPSAMGGDDKSKT